MLTSSLPISYRVQLTYATHPDEHFFGFGEQFSHFDLKGKRVPIIVQEQVGVSYMTGFQVTPYTSCFHQPLQCYLVIASAEISVAGSA